MPTIAPRLATNASLGPILGGVIGGLILISALTIAGVVILRRWRRNVVRANNPDTEEECLSFNPEKMFASGHRRLESAENPLLSRDWDGMSTLRRSSLDDVDLYTAPTVQPASYPPRLGTPPLHITIPAGPPIPPTVNPTKPEIPSPASSSSLYSQRSALPVRTRTHDPDDMNRQPHSTHLRGTRREHPVKLAVSPDSATEEPLHRGDTVLVSNLLKSRAKRASEVPQRAATHVSRIEREGSIADAEEDGAPARMMTLTGDEEFAATMDYHAPNSQS